MALFECLGMLRLLALSVDTDAAATHAAFGGDAEATAAQLDVTSAYVMAVAWAAASGWCLAMHWMVPDRDSDSPA